MIRIDPDDFLEILACAETITRVGKPYMRKWTDGEQNRLRVARHRTNAPTTHETSDAPPAQRSA